MSRVTPFAHTPTPAGQIRAPARRPCGARDRLGRATVAFVSGREAEGLGMKQLLSLCLFVRFSLFLRRPLGTRAHMTDKKSACLWARHTSSNPGRGNHRTPPRALRLVSGFSEKSTQMTCQKSSTILRNIQPLDRRGLPGRTSFSMNDSVSKEGAQAPSSSTHSRLIRPQSRIHGPAALHSRSSRFFSPTLTTLRTHTHPKSLSTRRSYGP